MRIRKAEWSVNHIDLSTEKSIKRGIAKLFIHSDISMKKFSRYHAGTDYWLHSKLNRGRIDSKLIALLDKQFDTTYFTENKSRIMGIVNLGVECYDTALKQAIKDLTCKNLTEFVRTTRKVLRLKEINLIEFSERMEQAGSYLSTCLSTKAINHKIMDALYKETQVEFFKKNKYKVVNLSRKGKHNTKGKSEELDQDSIKVHLMYPNEKFTKEVNIKLLDNCVKKSMDAYIYKAVVLNRTVPNPIDYDKRLIKVSEYTKEYRYTRI